MDFPIKNGDFPLLCKRSPEGNIVPLMLPSPSRGNAGGVSILGKGSPECTVIGLDSLTFH